MKKIIVFDFDGVIVDSLQMSYGFVKKMKADLTYSEWEDWSEENIYKSVKENGATNWHLIAYFWLYSRNIFKYKPVEGVGPFLSDLSSKYKLAVISFSLSYTIKKYLKKYLLAEYFSMVLGSDHGVSKTKKFNNLMNKFGVSLDEIIFITDSVGDVKTANRMGIQTIAVTWGIHDKKTLEKVKPSYIASNFEELRDFIGKLDNS